MRSYLSCGLLVAAFGGDTSRLIPLYAVGVFLSFTLSQSGMVRHWLHACGAARTEEKGLERIEVRDLSNEAAAVVVPMPDAQIAADVHIPAIVEADEAAHLKKSIIINGIGAIATFIVLVVFIITKFIHGAWIVILLIPLLVLMFRAIHNHYVSIAKQLSTEGLEKLRPIKNTVIVPISGVHRGVINALQYAKAIAPNNVTAVYVNIDEEATRKLREKWEQWGSGVELMVLASPYRSLVRPLMRYINRVARQNNNDVVTVLLPEFVPAKWWQHLLHNQSSLLLKGSLLFKKGIIVTSVPYHLEQ